MRTIIFLACVLAVANSFGFLELEDFSLPCVICAHRPKWDP